MDDSERDTRDLSVELDVPEAIRQGEYANFMQVAFTQWEFIITFGRIVPENVREGAAVAQAVSRIVIPHLLMPSIIDALVTNLNKFQSRMASVAEMETIQEKEKK